MEKLTNYIKPELLVVTVVIYFIGVGLKKAEIVKDKNIPLVLGGTGIMISAVYVFATCTCNTWKEAAMAIFTAITQGILVAGLSTYVNQLIKQKSKDE